MNNYRLDMTAGEGFSKSEIASQKYKTYRKMATRINTFLSLGIKYLGTANAKQEKQEKSTGPLL